MMNAKDEKNENISIVFTVFPFPINLLQKETKPLNQEYASCVESSHFIYLPKEDAHFNHEKGGPVISGR